MKNGVSRYSALVIQTNAVKVEFGGPDKNGKYAGWISLDVQDRWKPLISTGPLFDSPEKATAHMEALVEKIRSADIVGEVQRLEGKDEL